MSNPGFLPKYELTERLACKASIMLEGLTGSGKSGLALMLGYGLVGGFKNPPDTEAETLWKQIFATDTENKSLNLFIGLKGCWGSIFDKFYSYQLGVTVGYRPSNYLTLRDVAVKQGGKVNINDSITHMWNAKGGVLDMVNEFKQNNPYEKDNYRIWGDPEIAAEKQRIMETMRHADIHCITTVRVKEKHEYQWNDDKKKNDIISLGYQQIQQADLKYEPDLVLHMLRAGNSDGTVPKVKVQKSRYAIFKKDEEYDITPEICEQLRTYLEEGVDPETIFEQQRQDYIKAVTEVLDQKASNRAIWKVLKKDVGNEDTKLQDMALETIKKLFVQLTIN